MKKIYLAGPDVFKPNAKEIGEQLKIYCTQRELEGVFPLDEEVDFNSGTKEEVAKCIQGICTRMIHECDAVVANLSPFRGPSADVGTVWECAYAKALGMPVFGYGDRIEYKDKVFGTCPHDGMLVEDFHGYDNLMLVHGIDNFSQFPFDALDNLVQFWSENNG